MNLIIKKTTKRIYLVFRLWSLDVVIGSLAVGGYFVHIFEVSMPKWWWVILPLSVWIIYTTDHLLDGLKTKNINAAIYRHQYHYKNKKLFVKAIISAIIIDILMVIIFLPEKLILRGIVLSFFVAAYLFTVHFINKKRFFYYQKEFVIATVYTIGIILGPITISNKSLTSWQFILVAGIALLTWAEGLLAAWFDYDNDIHDGHVSFATVKGKKTTKYFILFINIFIFVLLKINVLLITNYTQFFAIIIEALMNLILLIMLLSHEKFKYNDRYRILGEMVFWIPGIMIFF
jgi:4-hydroxybenzoate polyprenyltransferase